MSRLPCHEQRSALSSSSELRKKALAAVLNRERWRWNSGWTTDVLAYVGTQRAESITYFLQVAHAQRIPINTFHFIRAMSLCSQASFWKDALEVFMLYSKACRPHPMASNSLLAALAEGSLWQLALSTLQEAQPAVLKRRVLASMTYDKSDLSGHAEDGASRNDRQLQLCHPCLHSSRIMATSLAPVC